MQFQFQLKKNHTLVSAPYFNSLCPWLVEQDRPEMTSVVQSIWMAPKTPAMDSEDVQNQKQICFLKPLSVCSQKKFSRTPLEITTICLERRLEKSHFSLSHSKTSALQKAASQREVSGKLYAEDIVRHETLHLDKIFFGKTSLNCTNNRLVSTTQAHQTILWMSCVLKDSEVVLTQFSFSRNTICLEITVWQTSARHLSKSQTPECIWYSHGGQLQF